MAEFKVGQRVRFIDTQNEMLRHLVGTEGTVIAVLDVPPFTAYEVQMDAAVGIGHRRNTIYAPAWHLAPLTPPKEEEEEVDEEKLNEFSKLVADVLRRVSEHKETATAP